MIPITPTLSSIEHLRHVRRLAAVTTGLLLCLLALGATQARADSQYWVEACTSSFTNVWTLGVYDTTSGQPIGLPAGTNAQDGTARCSVQTPSGLWSHGMSIEVGTATTTPKGVAAAWSVTAPGSTHLIGLSYIGGSFVVGGGWGAGWFGKRDGDGTFFANEDPTNPGLSNAHPQWDCLAANQNSYDTNVNNHTETTGACGDPGSNSSGSFNFLASGGVGPLRALALGMECRAGSCAINGYAGVTQASVEVDDPQDAPAGELGGDLINQPNGWETGAYRNSAGSDLSVTASDSAGVCDVTLGLFNSAGQAVAANANSQGVAYDAATGAFTSPQPCGASNLSTSISPNMSSLPDGVYYLNAYAQNPADWRAGSYGWLYGGGPTSGPAIYVDNSTPTASYDSSVSQSTWASSSSAIQLDVNDSDGYGTGSGVAHVTCSNEETGNPITLSVDGNGDPVTVPASEWTEGTSTVDCTATSNVGTDSATHSFTEHVDTQTPSTSFEGAGTTAPDVPTVLDAAPGANANDDLDPPAVVNADEHNDESSVPSSTCTVNGGTPVTIAAGAAIPATQFQDGPNDVSCYSTTGAGLDNSAHPAAETVNVEQTAPQIAFGGASAYNPSDPSTYANGPVQIAATGAEPDGTYPNSSTFGVQSVSCSVDGDSYQTVAADHGTFNVTGDGQNTVSCYATNDAGVQSAPVSEVIAIDSHAPSPGTSSISSGPASPGGYTRTDESITLSFNSNGGAQMAEIRCTLAGVTTDYSPGNAGVTMSNNNDTETVSIDIPPPGGTLTCQGEDTAGNWSSPESWNFNIDDTPPTGVFEPQQPANPALIQALLADSGSGVANAQIQINEHGTWQNLATTYNPVTGIASASMPDDGSISDGTYPLQVLATDNAGNSTAANGSNVILNSSGQPETITLPLRIVTQLSAVLAAGTTQVNAVASTPMFRRAALSFNMAADAKKAPTKKKRPKAPKGCTYKRVVTRKVNLKKHIKAASKLVKVCATTKAPPAKTGALTLAYGQTSTVTGELQTRQNVPIPNAQVAIEQTVSETPTSTVAKPAAAAASTAAQTSILGKATTNAKGQFTYTIPAGPSRTLTFLYQGTPVLRTSSASQNEMVDGQSTISMPRKVVHGKKVTISGHLNGGFLPTGGAMVQLWYTTKGGLVQWAPFAAAVHTNAKGAWKLTFPVAKKAKGITYVFKAVVSTQAGWAYLGTTTAVITRKIS